MATFKLVTFTIQHPDGTPWAAAPVRFRLRPGAQVADLLFPAFTRTALTEDDGTGSVELWANEEGELSSEYSVELPSGELRYFILPVGDDPIDLSVLIAAYLGPSDPNYTSLMAVVQEVLGARLDVIEAGTYAFNTAAYLNVLSDETGYAGAFNAATAHDAIKGVRLSPGVFDRDANVSFGSSTVGVYVSPGVMLRPPAGRTYTVELLAVMPGPFQWIDLADGDVVFPPGEMSPAWMGLDPNAEPTVGTYVDGCFFNFTTPGISGGRGMVYTTDEFGEDLRWRLWGLIDEE